jgi:16S rRNA G966 N2-methylase RsmD
MINDQHELKNVTNPKSIHGIYPYRGKISAIEARSIISGFSVRSRILDPFCGSGTIVYEAKRQGMRGAWGTDVNPLAEWLTQAKLNCPATLETAIQELETLQLASRPVAHIEREFLLTYFHHQTLSEIEALIPHFSTMSHYVRGCFVGTIALAARGCNGYQWTSSTVGKNIQPKRYIPFFEKFKAKIRKHHFPTKSLVDSGYQTVDARHLADVFSPSEFDIVFSSPPYFDALDYTAYYAKIVYALLSITPQEVKQSLIQKTSTYRDDMKQVLSQIVQITAANGKIIFVVGDKKTKNGVVNGGEFFSELLEHQPTSIHERSYTGSSSQVFDALNRTTRKEQIVVWDKSKW